MKTLCIEFVTGPIVHVLVVFVLRVHEDVEEIGVATSAAAVFRRATPGTANYAGVLGIRLSRHGFFERDSVPPVIAEVVDILNLSPQRGQNFGKTDLALKDDLARLVIR